MPAQISPFQDDRERVIPAGPDLVAVLARIIRRIKGPGGRVPRLNRYYDGYERSSARRCRTFGRRPRRGGLPPNSSPTTAASSMPTDLRHIERLLREARTWVLIDPLAVHVAGVVVAAHLPWGSLVLDRWAADSDFWVRRAAILALLPGIRTHVPDLERLSRYADAMLEEKEFFIRKALGRALRETAKDHPEFVTNWVEEPRAVSKSR